MVHRGSRSFSTEVPVGCIYRDTPGTTANWERVPLVERVPGSDLAVGSLGRALARDVLLEYSPVGSSLCTERRVGVQPLCVTCVGERRSCIVRARHPYGHSGARFSKADLISWGSIELHDAHPCHVHREGVHAFA